jgi:hypothetical protein
VSLVPVPSEQPGANCANCGAALVADQRYCLSCGRPVSPVRLAFLDALTPGPPAAAPPAQTAWGTPATIEVGPAGYLPPASEQGLNAWLRRNSGLMGLLTVLILCLGIGLLLGHWVSQSKSSPGSSTIKVEGLAGLAGTGAASAGSSTTPSSTTPAPATSTKGSSTEAKEAEEGEHETAAEKAPPKKPVKVAPTTLKKLTQSSGKKHQEEINALGSQPIETG